MHDLRRYTVPFAISSPQDRTRTSCTMRIAVLGLVGLVTAISAAGPAAKFKEPQGHMMIFNGAPNVAVRRYSPWSWTNP